MVVLRIADYIQIDSSRVNEYLIKLKSFSSPISSLEHDTHLAVDSISFFNQEDRERLYVTCSPTNIIQYEKLNNLFTDIQSELDVSWAILGEIYGFYPDNKPYIKFRRIMSNLKNKRFINNLKYVPKSGRFILNKDLSKLLIAPLYGDNPTFGIRELMQNSVDACNERKLHHTINNENYTPEININIHKLDENYLSFQIIDNGKGMNTEELFNYFFNVGSSFRNSLGWKKKFVNDENKTIIKRSGKFGIGVLASFLVGDEMTFQTRHFKEQYGYFFIAKLNSNNIQIIKKSNIECGTMISFKISTKKWQLLNSTDWKSWYVYDNPKITFNIEGNLSLNQGINTLDYNIISSNLYNKLAWKDTKTDYLLACNGIIIERSRKKNSIYGELYDRTVINISPTILIDDNEGNLPIKLDRNSLDDKGLHIKNTIITELSKKLIAKVLTLRINSFDIYNYPLDTFKAHIVYNINGFSLNICYFLEQFYKKNFKLIKCYTSRKILPKELLYDPKLLVEGNFNFRLSKKRVTELLNSNVMLIRTSALKKLKLDINEYSILKSDQDCCLISRKIFTIENNNYRSNKRSRIKRIDDLVLLKDFTLFKRLIMDYNFILTETTNTNTFSSFKTNEELKILLKKFFNKQIIIPYRKDERQKTFKKAFKELNSNINNETKVNNVYFMENIIRLEKLFKYKITNKNTD